MFFIPISDIHPVLRCLPETVVETATVFPPRADVLYSNEQ